MPFLLLQPVFVSGRRIEIIVELLAGLQCKCCPKSKASLKFMVLHYENLPMQCTKIFKDIKSENFQQKIFDIFLIFGQNIDVGTRRRGGSNEYPQSMFWRKNRYTPVYPSFTT